MTKQVDGKNQIWYEQSEQGVTRIGFTRSFLDRMDQCWHILPANRQQFKEKSPLMVVETNDSLISILAPIAGNFGHWSSKAQNFPNKLTEDDVVIELRKERMVQPEPPQAAQPDMQWHDELMNNLQAGGVRATFAAAPQAAVRRTNRGQF